MGALLALIGLVAMPASGSAKALAPVDPVMPCEALGLLDLRAGPGIKLTIITATVQQGQRPYCRVMATVAPAIRIEVRMPTHGWTQRYLQTGCGGLCGWLSIRTDHDTGCTPVTQGDVVLASTDMGHQATRMGDESWGNGPQARIDFAHRGVHATVLVAKALISAYYGRPQRYAYFSGCSDGGREALIEAQRYPGDFDGIAAGAPALNFTVQNSFYHAGQALTNTGPDGKALINPADLPVLHRQVVAQCDAIDGLADGIIDDPRKCRPDLSPVQCAGEARPGECLTAPQVAAALRLYQGATDAQGRHLVIGGPQPGSELSWAGVFVPKSEGAPIFSVPIALGTINNLLFTPNPSPPMTLDQLHFDKAALDSLDEARRLYNADDPDLSGFAARKGRLLLWHGWSDPHISPLNTIDYYARVGQRMGTARRASFSRLFLFPGMYHCSGGDGPSEFPLLAALMAWVEDGKAPDVLVTSTGPDPAGRLHRSRPVYAWPQVARYTGSGSIDEATNFTPTTPPPENDIQDWLGAR